LTIRNNKKKSGKTKKHQAAGIKTLGKNRKEKTGAKGKGKP